MQHTKNTPMTNVIGRKRHILRCYENMSSMFPMPALSTSSLLLGFALMRVGIVTYDFQPPIGGLGVMASHLCGWLRTCYPQHTYLAVSPCKESDVQTSPIARLLWNKKGGCPCFSLSLLWSLHRIVRTHNLDVLHVHSGSGGVWLLRKPPCRLLVTAHHSYVQEASTVFRSTPLSRAWKLLMSKLERRTYLLADHITCVSEDTRQALHRSYGIPLQRMTVVENAVDLSRFQPKQGSRQQQTVLFAGRMEARKGIWVFLRAMQSIRNACGSVQFRFCGQNLLGEKLMSVLSREGLIRSTTLLGRVHEPYLIRELQSAAVVVVPSLVEGFGLLAAEAMACGACVVASDCDGLRSIVKHKETGLVFRNGDAEELAAMVILALRDEQMRSRLGRQASVDAHQRFAFKRQAEHMQACLDMICSK